MKKTVTLAALRALAKRKGCDGVVTENYGGWACDVMREESFIVHIGGMPTELGAMKAAHAALSALPDRKVTRPRRMKEAEQ